MELRQIRYFVRVLEVGSMSRAAAELGVVQSALSQQISRLEGELSVRLMTRTRRGITPTQAGLAFLREAQLILRHAEQARRAAQQSRLTGTASVGLAPTTASVLALPFMRAMRDRYPDVRLHIVECLSGQLEGLLEARKLDFAILFNVQASSSWNVIPLMEEKLFLIQSAQRSGAQRVESAVSIDALKDIPLILPTGTHGLRSRIDSAFGRAGIKPDVVAEIDSLVMLMDAVDAGLGATVQPSAAVLRYHDASERFVLSEIDDLQSQHVNVLCSLADDEMSPAALCTRLVLTHCMRTLVQDGRWPDARLINQF
ncbi:MULTISPECIES: LysR substrate-binding domain-containing protein [unclassified Achromobacter]|uniref:LysR family transcriptional regulator n=1 Tax=unclassified Achromobacter TaxID=2626865 RepID=UPI000B5159F5|nr:MULTISPECIES: LysR substrate-binding domain-containing protein [unclassified Achromobacter]OWT73776.1 LysR family transcriptional regulator [Achromobacter sp. HZ34]OWT79308.1 LysR family transcriptional regulator [Achromobacter sp. HZ28]